METTKETKAGQWHVKPLNPYQAQILDGDGKRVAFVGEFGMNLPTQAEAIADSIVRAVNAHGALVAACEETLAELEKYGFGGQSGAYGTGRVCAALLRAALALAQGGAK